MNEELDVHNPATLVKMHPDCTVIIDKEIANEIGYQYEVNMEAACSPGMMPAILPLRAVVVWYRDFLRSPVIAKLSQ